jgi:hypothetical protein
LTAIVNGPFSLTAKQLTSSSPAPICSTCSTAVLKAIAAAMLGFVEGRYKRRYKRTLT